MTWKHSDIRHARQTPLKPVCEALGYRLEQLRDGNYRIDGPASKIVIKDNYWVCTDSGAAGNAIDFLVDIEGMAFRKAMRLLCETATHVQPPLS